MFDIGFAELLIIGVVGLLVIGPERLPATVRTVGAYLNRLRRGFNEIKREVQQELHNDAVMQQLRETGEKLRQDTQSIGRDIQQTTTGARPETQAGGGDSPDGSEGRAGEPPPPGEDPSPDPKTR